MIRNLKLDIELKDNEIRYFKEKQKENKAILEEIKTDQAIAESAN